MAAISNFKFRISTPGTLAFYLIAKISNPPKRILWTKSKLLLCLAAFFIATSSFSQIARDFLAGSNLDLIKSNQHGYFERAQGGLELNYFFSRKFTGTGGIEYWTESKQLSLVIGSRWFPVPEAFVRLRGLVGTNDFSIGGGWAKPLDENWRFEAIGDVYARGNIAIRAGVAYLIRNGN